MFSNHVTNKLSAYCHEELNAEESRQVAEHLIGCHSCRTQFDEIKLGVKLAEQLPLVSAPDSLWLDLQARLSSAKPEEPVPQPFTKRSLFSFKAWQPGFAGAAAGVILSIALIGLWLYSRESRPFWEVARINGNPRIGSSRIDKTGRLAVGQWLETDGSSRARIEVSSIGQVEVDPNTRIRLVETKPTEHRLELAQGRMSARIWAPPRLFFVDTPSAVAADLGCAYTLEVDDKGVGILHVTSGWVALQLKERESMVPAGASCATQPGVGPGTPYFSDATEEFRNALFRFDFEARGDASAKTMNLESILSQARPRDTLTLWHLLERVEGDHRSRVYDRLAALGPPPAGVTRDGVLRLDETMVQNWKDHLATTWSNESGVRKGLIKVWNKSLGKVRGVDVNK